MRSHISHSYRGSINIQRYGNETQMRCNQNLAYIGSYGVSYSTSQKGALLTFQSLAAPLETIGLFGFAWTSIGPPHVHWIAPMIFSACIAIANVGYLVEHEMFESLTDYSSMQFIWPQSTTWSQRMVRIPLRLQAGMRWPEISWQVLLRCIQLPVSDR